MTDGLEPPNDESLRASHQPQGERIASGFRVVSILTLLSRILGMVRDMAMAYAFGAGQEEQAIG